MQQAWLHRGSMSLEQINVDRRAASRNLASTWSWMSAYLPLKSIACLLACVVFTALTAPAQGVGTSGEITGTVTDSAGNGVLNYTVTVLGTQTGLTRTAVTNSTGQFRVTGLSPAAYDVSAVMSGFATEIRKGVVGGIGYSG